MAERIDVMFRVGDSTSSLAAKWGAGGSVALTLSAGLYDLAGLCGQVATQLQTVNAAFTCSETDGAVTIGGDGSTTIEVTWGHLGLRDWLGYAADLAGSTSYTGSMSPGTWLGTYPTRSTIGVQWHRKMRVGSRGHGGSVQIARLRTWDVTVTPPASSRDQWLSVLGYLMTGSQIRWWRDTAVTTAWSWSTWWGFVDAAIGPAQRTITEDWPSNLRTRASFHVRLQEAP